MNTPAPNPDGEPIDPDTAHSCTEKQLSSRISPDSQAEAADIWIRADLHHRDHTTHDWDFLDRIISDPK